MTHRSAALASVFALSVLACGDDSSDPSGSASSSSSTSGAGSTSAGPASSASTGAGGDPGSGGGGSSASSTGGGGAGGSGGAGPLDDVIRSGTRLRAIYLDAGGEALRAEGFYDSELEIECGATAIGGELRCLPRFANVVRFRDAACTQPVLVADGCTIPPYAVGYDIDACEIVYSAYRAVGAEEEVDQLYSSYAGGCSALAPQAVTVRNAEPAAASSFVRFDVSREELDAELARETMSSDDGAFAVFRAIDLARDEACSLQVPAPADGGRPCVPRYGVRQPTNVAFWAEGTCTEPALVGTDCNVDATYPILDIQDLGCGVDAGTLHERGELLESVWETFGNGPQCLEQPPALRGVALGPPVDPGSLPELDVVERAGDELTLALDARAERVVGGGVFSDASGARCRPTATVDGDVRCVPEFSESESESIYADAACTQRLERVQPGDCEVPAYVLTYDTELGCGEFLLAAAHELGAVHEGALYELDGEGACIAHEDSGRFAVVGAEVALGTFPLVERVID